MSRPSLRGPAVFLLSFVMAALVLGVAWRAGGNGTASGDAGAAARSTDAAQAPARVTFTLRAGWRAEEVAGALDQAGLADRDRFLELVHHPATSTVLAHRWDALSSLEGYLSPGEYELPSDVSADSLIEILAGRFHEVVGPELRVRAGELGLSLHDVVTLASIVQREMVSTAEAPVIAGVFRNRLARGMRLESDPTVLYGLDTELGATNAGYWQRTIRRSDLRRADPYNTYARAGLPPGPIANPGIEAIKAVLYPANFDHLFFVARGHDAHVFARTQGEHEANVTRFGAGTRPGRSRKGDLQSLVERIMASVHGRVGVVVKNLATGERAVMAPDEYFTAASLYKLAVMSAAFRLRERGKLSFDEVLHISPAAARKDDAELRARLGTTPTVGKAIEEMIVVSSNAAGRALQDRIGREEVDRIIRRLGLRDTSVASKPPITTPANVARLLAGIATGRAVSGRASRAMFRVLLRQQIDDGLPRYLPEGARLAHKTGTLGLLRHDAGILSTSAGPVVVAALTEDVASPDGATEAIARLGRGVHDYFERYVPAAARIARQGRDAACPASPFRPRAGEKLAGRSIVLDPGHGGRDVGATHAFADGSSLREKDVALDVALRLRDVLLAQGAEVHMTRCEDAGLSVMSRAALANRAAADLVVSLHFHRAAHEGWNGTEVRYTGEDGTGLALNLLGTSAEPGLWDALTADHPTVYVGPRQSWGELLVQSNRPTAVTIPVRLSDPDEARRLRRKASAHGSRRDAIARGLLRGISAYLGVHTRPPRAAPPQTSPLVAGLTTSVVGDVEEAGRRVALTFDDCTNGGAWNRILDELAAARVKATLFCTGTMVARQPALALRTVRDGHSIGSHGWDHTKQLALPRPALRRRFAADISAWRRVAKATPTPYFRPPFGAYDERTLSEAARAGFSRTVLWDVDSLDWSKPGPGRIVERVVRQAAGGSIVLLHVLAQTADALPSVIRGLRARGLEPTDLDSLFAAGQRSATAGRHARRR